MKMILAIIAISTFIFARNINDFPLRNWDEAWYAQIIKNMASNNHSLLAPYWNGRYYFDKPPLYFWLSLPFFKIFGPGEWQTRIVSATSAILASLLIYLIGKKLFSQKAAILAFLAFLTFGQVIIRFAHGNLDALLVFLILASFYFYLLSEKNRKWTLACGIFAGLSFLAKGYLPGLYSLAIILLYALIAEKKLPRQFATIVITTLLVSIWYYFAGFLKFGEQFISWYLFSPDAGLLKSPLSSFSLSYFMDLARDVGFWWILVILAIIKKVKLARFEKSILIAFTVLTIIYITPLNFLSEKLGWYNLPTYPLIALVVGLFASKINLKAVSVTFISIIIILQVASVIRIENIYPDRSNVGATLGNIAKSIIPTGQTMILDDKDFTSFLFYSNHDEVFVSLPQGGKDWEWWIIRYENLEEFIKENPNSWIITKNLSSLPINKQGEIKAQSQGYTFAKF